MSNNDYHALVLISLKNLGNMLHRSCKILSWILSMIANQFYLIFKISIQSQEALYLNLTSSWGVA